MKTIAFVLYTGDITFDDRVRKEYISLTDMGYRVQAFAVTQDNRSSVSWTRYGMRVETISLSSRNALKDVLPSSLKLLELAIRLRTRLKQFDLVWLHDAEMAGIATILRKQRIVLDLHEVPESFMVNSVKRYTLKIIERHTSAIIHANQERLEFAFSNKLFAERGKHYVLRNYPERAFVENQSSTELSRIIAEWSRGSELVYVQGISSEQRFPRQTIQAIMSVPNTKVLVAGRVPGEHVAQLRAQYGRQFDDRVFLAGMVNSLELAPLIRLSRLAVVLYDGHSPNCRLCEPNRLHQCLSLNVPVVVGRNETMRKIVSSKGYGISVDTFGEDYGKVAEGIRTILTNSSSYSFSTEGEMTKMVWEGQHSIMANLLKRIEKEYA
jgi:glycosyltransferase involved in cell wall biosynthesis